MYYYKENPSKRILSSKLKMLINTKIQHSLLITVVIFIDTKMVIQFI
jgi:hypothetical protein